MPKCSYMSFLGHELQVYENRLRSQGTVIRSAYRPDGVLTLTTETGEYSFYYIHPKPSRQMLHLANGAWKIHGDGPRWAYLVKPKEE